MTTARGNWIDRFVEYTEGIHSPPIFRRWAAVSIIAGILERKVWTYTKRSRLYPNLYIMLVGPAAGGKTSAYEYVQEFWRSVPETFLSSTSVSRASLVDDLNDSKRKITRIGEVENYIEYNPLLIGISELGTFMPQYDNDFISTLTDLWDGKRYQERKRTLNTQIQIDHPCINLFAGVTPHFLLNVFPEGAWEQGFASRTIMVYSGEEMLTEVFQEDDIEITLEEDPVVAELKEDLLRINSLYGKMSFTPASMEVFRQWYYNGQVPKPLHPKLRTYASRRPALLLKLCQILSAAESNDLVIHDYHVQAGLDLMIQTELTMEDLFKAGIVGGDSSAMEDTWHYIRTLYMKENNPIQQQRVIYFVQQKVPAHNVMRIIEIMTKSGMLIETSFNGMLAYKPGMKVNY